MHNSPLTAIMLLCSLTLFLSPLSTQSNKSATAEQVMALVVQRNDGNNSTMNIQLDIKRGSSLQQRRLRGFTCDFKNYDASLFQVLQPANLQGIAYLLHDYNQSDGNTLIWNYLPALKKTKRIPASSQRQSFLGSDLILVDLISTPWSEYQLSMIDRSFDYQQWQTWKIIGIPTQAEQQRSGYSKATLLVDQQTHIIVQAQYQLVDGGQKLLTVRKIEKIDGIWTATHLLVHLRGNDGRDKYTQMLLSELRYNRKVKHSFTADELGF